MPFRSPQNFFAQINNFFFVADPASVKSSIFKTPLDTDNPEDKKCLDEMYEDFVNQSSEASGESSGETLENQDFSRFYIRECCANVSRKMDPTIDIEQLRV